MVIPKTYGRMGNFLFQAAAALAYAWDHDLEVTMPARPYPPKHYPVYLPHLVNPAYVPSLPTVTIEEKGFPHQVLPFEESWRDKNIVLDGYWQSEKYFKRYRDDILNHFDFGRDSLPGTVSVHVRRGDYLRLRQKHPPVTAEWMMEQMSKFPGAWFHFFSDDIAWCKSVFGRRRDCVFSEGKKEVDDLIKMSWCSSHICSASTFSWWGAWLNQNPKKRIIMPKRWFVEGWGGVDVSQIVPLEWERA
jgi:hypothetical protein